MEEKHIEELEDSEEEDHNVFNEKLQSRFYRKDFPEEGDLVIVNILNTLHVCLTINIDSNNQGARERSLCSTIRI